MDLIVDAENLGTEEHLWRAAFVSEQVGEWSWGSPERVVFIAPHPDDEVLALGGSLMRLARAGCKIDLVSVTHGEASHPRSHRCSPLQIAKMRQIERADALAALSLADIRIIELGLRDGHVADVAELVDRLTPLVRGATFCVAPWSRDGHPDHDASGIAAALACEKTGTHLVEYLVWGWHWAAPKAADFPWVRVRKVSLRDDEHAAKLRAIAKYHSQIGPLAPDEPEVILPPRILERFQRTFEVVLA